MTKDSRYTLGVKIDNYLIEMIDSVYIATYLNGEKKLPYLQKAVSQLDLIKFFLQIGWEVKALDNKKYLALSEKLDQLGKMLGGWIRQIISKKNPAQRGE